MRYTGPAVHLDRLRAACGACSLHELCLPHGLGVADLARLEDVVGAPRVRPPGRVLFRAGEPFHSLFVPRSGTVKTTAADHTGAERVLGFHLPGEIVGLDGLANGYHQASARTLETASVCEVPFAHLERVMEHVPALAHRFVRLMSQDIAHREGHLLTLTDLSSDRRVATLLLSLAARWEARGYSGHEFNLSMSRQEIASYLGLAPETVSRALRRLQTRRLIAARGRLVRVLDDVGLHALADVTPCPPACRTAHA